MLVFNDNKYIKSSGNSSALDFITQQVGHVFESNVKILLE